MKKLNKYWWIAAISALLFLPSCLDDTPAPLRLSVLGKTQCNPQDSTIWWFMADDSTTFVYDGVAPFTPYKNWRSIAYMELLDGKAKPGYDYVVNFVDVVGVLTNPVTATNLVHIDTSTSDDIAVRNAFVSLQYLNLYITVKGYSGALHKFYLLRDSLQTTEPIKLNLLHYKGKDAEIENITGTISFDLETLAERSTQDSVRIQLLVPSGDSANFIYRFKK